MKRRLASDEGVIAELWDGAAIRKIAVQFAEIAVEALLENHGPVRRPRSAATASHVLRPAARRKSAAGLAREIRRLSLHLAHPRYLAQQVAAPIPLAALIESVVAAMNQSLAVWEMSPIATVIDRQVMARFKRLFGYPREAEGTLLPGGAFGNLTALLAAREALKPIIRWRERPRFSVWEATRCFASQWITNIALMSRECRKHSQGHEEAGFRGSCWSAPLDLPRRAALTRSMRCAGQRHGRALGST